ncbi:MAG: mannose-6-phosphate isomerase, class I [Porphyromonas sp.]|nr:mannose-6-phosphate isomerase, class I [Porphyromonas sp.]
MTLYPLKFDFEYQRKIWGGDRIFKYKGEESPSSDIGETWEISPMKGEESTIAEGFLKGKTLTEVVDAYGARLLGQHVFDRYDGKFPLLIKMIDANDDLSVQVHPGDQYASEHHNGSWGKTEMWYILECEEDAKIYAGWRKETNPSQLKEIVKTDEVMEYLDVHIAEPGDVFFLPAGKVHAIGAGCLLLEIQQASDITYRLFDFNRTDDKGNKRELHVDQSVAVVNYEVNKEGALSYDRKAQDQPVLLATSLYFRTSKLSLTRSYRQELPDRDSFTVLFVANGTVELETSSGKISARQGETLLIPAELRYYEVSPVNGDAVVIESFVP